MFRRLMLLLLLLSAWLPGQDFGFDLDQFYRGELESNLRWQLRRLRRGEESAQAQVGVLADGGVWHQGARWLVEALEGAGVPCRLLDRDALTDGGLDGLQALAVPGGWAPFQIAALGEDGLDAIRDFVEGGGRYLGVCAGAYLAAREARWHEEIFPYPLQLADVTAAAPVGGLPDFPQLATARLRASDEGRELGLPRSIAAAYMGGCFFEPVPDEAVLARYRDGSPAVIRVTCGLGEVVLTGVHFECPLPEDGALTGPPPKGAGTLLKGLLRLAEVLEPVE